MDLPSNSANKAKKVFSVKVCPVCEDWQLQGSELATMKEIEAWYLEHLYECFGFPVETRVEAA